MQTDSLLDLLGPAATLWLAAFGLVIGSFLNVVIARVPREESIVRPRSRCPGCGHSLPWYENVPVISYLALRGRCSSCKARISPRYPMVELLTGLLFVACLSRFGWDYQLAPALMLVTLLIPLTFIDAEHWILPHALTIPGIALGVLMAIPLGAERVLSAALGAAGAFLLFRAMEFLGWLAFRKEALGAGDKFLFALLGAFLGYQSLFGLVFLSALQGSIFGIARLLLTGRAGPGVATPEAVPVPVPVTGQAGEGAPPPPADEPAPTMSWAFLKPGLPFGRRLLLLPWSVFLQPIPDDPVDEGGEEVEWVPGPTNLPFGPWLALAGLELMLLGGWLSANAPLPGVGWLLWGSGLPQ